MALKNYKAESRKDWGCDEAGGMTIEQINCGALLRIADAVEKMAGSVTSLVERCSRLSGDNLALERANRALRASVRRLKTKEKGNP